MILVVARRLGEMVFVLVSISVLVFLIFFATPGADPAARLAGRGATPATLAAVRHSFGLDKPLPVQYVLMMKHLFITQDLTSFVNPGEKVVPAVLQAVPVTLSLVFGAAIIWVVAALFVGVIAAWARDTLLDRMLMLFSLIGVSMPVFWLAEVANLITQARYHDTWLFSWVPALGYVPLSVSVVGWFKSLIIPWTVLAVTYIGLYGRVLRSNLVEAMNEDYIRTARAKGLSERQIILRHALRMSLITLVSMFGLDFGLLAGGGALLIEVVSGLPGVGELTYQALQNLDLPFIMAAVLYGAVFIVVANTVVDMLYAVIDPRAR
ncbi:ABC transporter permease [Acidiphilium sp.]|uniref:ABC transporter permease n=1 Tax=Acidiphilium sp. TaxID=527 RepID=UPI003D00B707